MSEIFFKIMFGFVVFLVVFFESDDFFVMFFIDYFCFNFSFIYKGFFVREFVFFGYG